MEGKKTDKLIEAIADLQNISITTKEDLRILTESLKTDLDWIKKLILAVGMAVVIAALKYIFIS